MSKRRGFLDVQSPLFRPLWLRVALVGICFAWVVVEATRGAFIWAVLFAAIGGHLAWQFFVVWDPDKGDKE